MACSVMEPEASYQREAWQDWQWRYWRDRAVAAESHSSDLRQALAVAVRERDQAREALREARKWLLVPSDIVPQHWEPLGRVREQIEAALDGAATPPTAPTRRAGSGDRHMTDRISIAKIRAGLADHDRYTNPWEDFAPTPDEVEALVNAVEDLNKLNNFVSVLRAEEQRVFARFDFGDEPA